MTIAPNPYHGFRFPPEIIEHAVWPYHCFSLSLRDVETVLAARGVVVSDEGIREWSLRFGRLFANALKRRRPRLGDKWFLDEVFVRIRGKLRYLWRAVDQDGHVVDILVEGRRDARATKRFFRKLLKDLQYVSRVIVTDKLRSYAAVRPATIERLLSEVRVAAAGGRRRRVPPHLFLWKAGQGEALGRCVEDQGLGVENHKTGVARLEVVLPTSPLASHRYRNHRVSRTIGTIRTI